MHVCLLVVVVAAPPELRLPPSDSWEVADDPVPQPGVTGGKFFLWKKNHDVRLRYGTVAAMKQDYTQSWCWRSQGRWRSSPVRREEI
ncbi:MAG: hypothetical protein Q8N23_17835 [Archangium sp.]|nr:hypothetical protein [Archangium sp.]MDP3154544.1 hypothetical protein [Archangium sp.]MDP3569417.1 hypothetical protein [Archangium sp.]